MVRITLVLLFVLLNKVSYGQDIEVPFLKNVEREIDLGLLIPIGLKCDSNEELVFCLKDHETSRIDSVQQYIVEALKLKPDYYLNIVTIEIIADKNIKIIDFEILQEEIKRLGFLKVFYVASSETTSKIPNLWSTGILYRLSSRDEERIKNYI